MKKSSWLLLLGLSVNTLWNSNARAMNFSWPFKKTKCESRVTAQPISEGQRLSERVLGLLDVNHPFRESRTRFLETVRDMSQYETQLKQLSIDYEKLLPELIKAYESFTKAPSPDLKSRLEAALLRVEILVDQISELCFQLKHSITIRIQELRIGLERRPDVMRQVPPEVLEGLRNPKSISAAMKIIGEGNRLSHLEISVMEEFQMIMFFIGFQENITKSMEEGFSPVLQEKIKLINFILGRSVADPSDKAADQNPKTTVEPKEKLE